MGDRATGMALAAGLLASLYKAEKTGKGDKVTISLYAMAVFVQATFLLKRSETLLPQRFAALFPQAANDQTMIPVSNAITIFFIIYFSFQNSS